MTDGQGRTALVTGASAGLGAEFAQQLAGAGMNLVLVARREDRLQVVADEVREAHGREVLPVVDDLADPEAPERIHATLAERGVHVDYLVNNAGAAGPDLLEDRDWSAHQAFYQLMMVSVAHLCHLFVPPMRERGWGRVINVASMAARIARAGGCNYGPTKAYVVALSEELAMTLAGTGVHVCALCPGFTHTEFHERAGMMDMKNASSDMLWYDAATVAREGIAAVERGRAVYPSGRLYRLVDPLMQSVWTRRLFRIEAAQ